MNKLKLSWAQIIFCSACTHSKDKKKDYYELGLKHLVKELDLSTYVKKMTLLEKMKVGLFSNEQLFLLEHMPNTPYSSLVDIHNSNEYFYLQVHY